VAARLAPQKSSPDGAVNPALEGDASSKPTPPRGPACTKPWPTWKSSLQSNRKRCWSTALQKLLLQSFTAEAQRVGRARSPLRAGVGCADPASGFESGFPRPYGRGYGARPSWSKKALTRSIHLDGAAAKMAARQSAQRRRELVGRVPHVRDAPPCVHPKTSGGQRTARPTSDRVLTKQNPQGKCG